jgi:sec-independent protein translocase protein TatB
MLVIAVVALIVIGPEKLPGVARTLGHLFGRMQRYVNDVKADIQREMELDELKKLRKDVEDSARSIEDSVRKEVDQAQAELKELETTTADPFAETAPRAAEAAAPAEQKPAQIAEETTPAAAVPPKST